MSPKATLLFMTLVFGCAAVASANPPGYGIINCDPQQGYRIFPTCLTDSEISAWVDVDSSGTQLFYLQYDTNTLCEGTADYNITFGPQCAVLIGFQFDFKIGVPPTPPVEPPVDEPLAAPVLAPVAAPVQSPVDAPTVAPTAAPTAAPAAPQRGPITASGSDAILVSVPLSTMISMTIIFVL